MMIQKQQLTTEKSATTIYKIAGLIVLATLLIYIHDVIPKGYGHYGKSSLRVFLYVINAEIRFLMVLFLLFYVAKGEKWRFVLLLPILMTTYQLIIRFFVLQKTSYNEFDTKFVITIAISILLIIYYFRRVKNEL